MIRPVITALVATAVLMLPRIAAGQAQEPGIGDCGPRQAVTQYVIRLMGDPKTATHAASVENGLLVEEISNDRRWIKLATHQNGATCIVGHGWRT